MYVKGAVSSMVEVGEGILDAKQQEYNWKKNNKVIFELDAFTCSNRLVVIANFLLTHCDIEGRGRIAHWI